MLPETTMPVAMSPHTRYAVLDEAQKLEDLRPCLMKKDVADRMKNGSSPLLTPSVLNDIDSFLASAFGWSGITFATRNSIAFSVSKNLQQLLSSDLLAQQLRIGIHGGPEEYGWRHILWVHALESGGSVIRRERFWGSKIRYSGGSIVTYALVTMDGPLECSGSFYDYGGPLSAKDFQTKGTPTLAAKIPVSGGCRALVTRQSLSGLHH